MKAIFIGGLKNGKLIANYLNEHKKTDLLKVYVLKDELGKDVSDFVTFDNVIPEEKITKVEKINDYEEEIENLRPDIIFVVGWSQLVSEKIIKSAKLGVVGFHPAKLPKDRGRSVLAWQVAEGYTKGCVSMIWIDNGVDTGNLIGQKEYNINYNDSIREVLDKVYNICLELTEIYYPFIVNGNIISIKQNDELASYRRKRSKKDGVINWDKNSHEIYNLVRAVTEPYPGAITYYEGKEFLILSCFELIPEIYHSEEEVGTILEFKFNKGMVVKCKDKAILINKIKLNKEYLSVNSFQNYFCLGKKLEKGDN